MSVAVGIKDELVVILDLEDIIAQTKPMLRENDEETYEEEAVATSPFSNVGKQETTMAPTIVEVVMVSKISSEGKMETAFALLT